MKVPVAIAVAVIAAIIIVSGITLVATGALVSRKNPAEVLTLAINRSEALGEYDINYTIMNSVTSDEQDLEIGGSMRITKSGDKKKIVYNIDFLGAPSVIEIYKSPGETVMCSSPFGTRQCLKVSTEEAPMQDPLDQQLKLKQQLDEGAVNMKYVGTSGFAGRGCDVVSAVYDIKKLAQTAEALNQEGLDAIKSMNMEVCIEPSSGLPLSTDLVIVVDSEQASGTIKTVLKANYFSLDAPEIRIPPAQSPGSSLFGSLNGTFQ